MGVDPSKNRKPSCPCLPILSANQTHGLSRQRRICIQPLEGYDSGSDGSPSELVYRRYRRFARSGAGLVWFESAAVAEDGKSNPHQMMLTPAGVSAFGALLGEMDRISLDESGFRQYKVLQLTHSGRVSRAADWTPKPLAARLLETDTGETVLASDERIFRLIEETISHAVMAKEAGFDAVDVKACHGYFLGELLSAFERKGAFGGSFENRTKALLAIVDGIRARTGGSLALTVRLMSPGLSAAGCVVKDPDPYASLYRRNVLDWKYGAPGS